MAATRTGHVHLHDRFVDQSVEATDAPTARGLHTSTRQLEADIRAFIEKHNEDPKPFRWTKSADDILAAVKRFCLRVDQNLCHEL